MRLAILGTRGIPNRYGGFEQISETLARGLVARGHEVTVYCVHHHDCQETEWHGVRRVLCHDPQMLKTFGQFVYDLNCIRHARRENFDAWLFMGYTSSSVWGRLFPKNTAVLSNMDGLEWKRSKYPRPVQLFLRHAEKLAVRYSLGHIADSPVIQEWLRESYGIQSQYIPYGATVRSDVDPSALEPFGLKAQNYYMIMARMEPENHIDIILEGFVQSACDKKMIVVGNTANRYGKSLVQKYRDEPRIVFAGGIFNQDVVHQLRAQAALYFHGHSVGGTNPSLLEAMASGALIAAHRNAFNECVLGGDGFYFSGSDDVAELIRYTNPANGTERRKRHQQKITDDYSWGPVIDQYESYILQTCHATCR